jgi:hypothetical protein
MEVHAMPRSTRWLIGLFGLWVLAASHPARAICGDDPQDAGQVAAVRAAIASQCNCSAAADTHRQYVKCAHTLARAAQQANALRQACLLSVTRCARQSTVGKPGAVVCCTTDSRGVTRGSIKPNASMCRAHRGGTACVAYALNTCDGCTTTGCFIAPTSTPGPTPTPTPIICPEPLVALPPNLVSVPLTLGTGTTDCGGPGFNPPALPPFSGEVDDVNGVKLADLGLGCQYAGSLPAIAVPGGSTASMSVVGVTDSTLVLGGSDGSGPTDCTRGAGPDTHCINGSPGTDNQGACASDTDCGGNAGTCAPDAHCFFGPPIATGSGSTAFCVVNTLLEDLCGTADTSGNTQVRAIISARLYSGPSGGPPCPQCVNGACDSGASLGQQCTGTGAANTTVECLPSAASYFTSLTVPLAPLTTATSTLTHMGADFCARPATPTPVRPPVCPKEPIPSAFGLENAGTIRETGSGLLSGGTSLTLTLGATFCIPRTGSLLDDAIGFPIPGAISATGTLDLSNALPIP